MSRNGLVTASAAIVLALSAVDRAPAQDAVKIGLILPMTGQQASTGRQIDAAVRLYVQQNGANVAGKKVANPGDVRTVLSDAQKDGKNTVLMRVKSGEGTKFVALKLGKV